MMKPIFLRSQLRSFSSSSRHLDFSKMTIIGRVGTDFTEYTSTNDKRYVRYSIASQPRRDGPTNWYNITVFNENHINFLTQYVKKGYVRLQQKNKRDHQYIF